MRDVLFIALIFASAAALYLYIQLCGRTIGRP
jgi:hypothetical protein